MRSRRALAAALLALATAAGEARARVYLSQQEAIDRAFPKPARVERRTLYLTADQAARAAAAAGVPVESRVVAYYVGLEGDRAIGYAYFDTHLVRTLPETIMVLVAPEGTMRRIDIVSFDEPEDYLATDRWLAQFGGRGLDDDLTLKGGIRTLTGATLSARAVTQAARRVLALHRLFVAPPAAPRPPDRPGPRDAP
jgi:hypothetical protein